MDARETNSMMPARSWTYDRAWEDAFRLPREPLLSSTSVGWQDIHLEYHCQPPGEAPEHQDAEHEIYIPNFQCAQAMQWTIDGHYQQGQIGRGEIAIIPAHASHSLSWDFDAESTMFSLDPGFVSRIAYESIDPDTVELIPIFAQLDPLILGRAH